jgi:hypothetical protein
MLWPGIRKLGKELQLKRTDSEVVGMVQNCFVKMYDGNNMKILELFVPEINDSNKEYIINKLVESKVKKYEWLEYGLRIIFNEYVRPYPISKIRGILIDFTEYFSKEYPDRKPRCQKCGISKDVDAYCVDNTTLIICEDCYKSFENEINEVNLDNKYAPPNYLSGFVGSLLFSIPGILVTVLFFVFLDRLAAISSVLYVFLGIKGYKKFNGKVSRFGSFLIILSTIIMVGFGILVSYSIFILKELKTIDIELLISILKMPEIQQEIIKNIFISYVLSGLYLVIQFYQMVKEWRSEKSVKRAKEI